MPTLRVEDLDTFATTDSGNIVRDILHFLGERIDKDPDTSLTLSLNREKSLQIKSRRRRIITQTPHLMLAGMRRFDELAGTVLETIDRHLQEFPERRRAPNLTPHQEATLLTSLIRQCLISSSLIYGDSGLSKEESVHLVGRDITHLAAAYTDGWN